jgi:hypothetical protein
MQTQQDYRSNKIYNRVTLYQDIHNQIIFLKIRYTENLN